MSGNPIEPNGERNGPRARREPATTDALPSPSDASQRQPDANNVFQGTPIAVQAHLTGEPGTLPEVWCRKCEATVLPAGKGRCPKCNAFLRLNFAARKHPVNKLRRQQLLDKFVSDYRPNTQRLQSMCEQYAGVVEQLEVIKPGSPEHQRLVQLSQLLGAALEESRTATSASAGTSGVDLSGMTDDELIERTAALLQRMLEQRDLQRDGEAYIARASAEYQAKVVGSDSLPSNFASVEKAAPAAEPICPRCQQSAIDCAAMRERAPDVFTLLHPNDPEVAEKRNADNHLLMMRAARER